VQKEAKFVRSDTLPKSRKILRHWLQWVRDDKENLKSSKYSRNSLSEGRCRSSQQKSKEFQKKAVRWSEERDPILPLRVLSVPLTKCPRCRLRLISIGKFFFRKETGFGKNVPSKKGTKSFVSSYSSKLFPQEIYKAQKYSIGLIQSTK